MRREYRTFRSILLLISRRRDVPFGAEAFGSTSGTVFLPCLVLGLSVAELVVVHLIVPWPWLQLGLFVATVWGMFRLLGLLADRIVHPHLVNGGMLTLRWGQRVILHAPLNVVASVRRLADHGRTQPDAVDGLLVLTQFTSTDVRIEFDEPVDAMVPVPTRRGRDRVAVTEVRLHVDDPDAFVRAVTVRDAASTADGATP